jgi:hypothetical protein
MRSTATPPMATPNLLAHVVQHTLAQQYRFDNSMAEPRLKLRHRLCLCDAPVYIATPIHIILAIPHEGRLP